MIFRVSIKDFRFICSIRKVSNVVGVISRLKGEDNEHILMWDFDNMSLDEVSKTLETRQAIYDLPDIQILVSNQEKGNFHAYCFTRKTWQQAVVIVSSTLGIDWDFVRLALYRGNFTLRISNKLGGNKPKLVKTLVSYKEDCYPEDLETYIQYEIWLK